MISSFPGATHASNVTKKPLRIQRSLSLSAARVSKQLDQSKSEETVNSLIHVVWAFKDDSRPGKAEPFAKFAVSRRAVFKKVA